MAITFLKIISLKKKKYILESAPKTVHKKCEISNFVNSASNPIDPYIDPKVI
jgi:hypothetical protein